MWLPVVVELVEVVLIVVEVVDVEVVERALPVTKDHILRMLSCPLMERSERRPRPRIEALADLVFGLSLSIGSISLISSPSTSTGQIESHIAAFAFTFFILITAWIIYTADMSVLPIETKSITFLNVLLLLLVALVPYLLNSVEITNPNLTQIQASALRDFSSTLFAIDLAGVLFILAAFAHVISMEEKKLVEPALAANFRNGRNRLAVIAVAMAVSVAPPFWQLELYDIPLRIYIWYLPLFIYWLGRLLRPENSAYTP